MSDLKEVIGYPADKETLKKFGDSLDKRLLARFMEEPRRRCAGKAKRKEDGSPLLDENGHVRRKGCGEEVTLQCFMSPPDGVVRLFRCQKCGNLGEVVCYGSRFESGSEPPDFPPEKQIEHMRKILLDCGMIEAPQEA